MPARKRPASSPIAGSASASRRAKAKPGARRKGGPGAHSEELASAVATPGAGVGLRRAQITEIQRARLLAAAVRAVEGLGYADTTVAHITHRARVSRRTFYELFANREECLMAVIEDLLSQIHEELVAVELERLPWRERVRTGLWTILSLFDREPQLARVCVVQALRGGPAVLERREQILARLAGTVDEGRHESARGAALTPLTAEGLVGAAFTIVHARLLRPGRRPLVDLLGELMAMIVLPYLGAAAARREQTRPAPPAAARRSTGVAHVARDPLEGIPMRLTYRTARVLESVAERPGASNRAIAKHAGIADQGQVSKLLARLERLELLANAGEGHLKGEPNAWVLTGTGKQVAQSIRAHGAREREVA
jgi:AcrR family transcriptional regulator